MPSTVRGDGVIEDLNAELVPDLLLHIRGELLFAVRLAGGLRVFGRALPVLPLLCHRKATQRTPQHRNPTLE